MKILMDILYRYKDTGKTFLERGYTHVNPYEDDDNVEQLKRTRLWDNKKEEYVVITHLMNEDPKDSHPEYMDAMFNGPERGRTPRISTDPVTTAIGKHFEDNVLANMKTHDPFYNVDPFEADR